MHIKINSKPFYFRLLILYLHIKWTLYIFFKTPLHKRLRLSGFVMGLWILSLFGWRLASVLRSCYFWFRYVDDVVDHDLKCEESIEEFSQSRKELLENIHDEARLSKLKLKQIDWLIVDVYYACLKLGYDNQT